MPNPNHIQEIFERLNLQQIREFLLHGTEAVAVCGESHHEREAQAYHALGKMLRQHFPQEAQREAAEGELHQCIGNLCDVYIEIGLCCGAELMRQFRQC